MKTILRAVKKSNRKSIKHARVKDIKEDKFEGLERPLDSQHLLISTLLPPAVKAFLEQCEREVDELCGNRYQHDGGGDHRWGTSPGSIVLANQRVALEVPRVRGKEGEVILKNYQQFQDPRLFDQSLFSFCDFFLWA